MQCAAVAAAIKKELEDHEGGQMNGRNAAHATEALDDHPMDTNSEQHCRNPETSERLSMTHELTARLLLASRSQRPNSAERSPKPASTPPASSESNSMTNGSGYLVPCPLCQVPLEQRVFRQHLDRHYPRDSPVCPVIQCARRFAHPNSVRNHMRLKHAMQWLKMKAMRSSGGPFMGMNEFK